MKNSLLTLIGLITLPVFAMQSNSNSQPAQAQVNIAPSNQNKQSQPPKIKLAVYELNNDVPTEVGRKYSVSNKNHQLCWAAFNIPLEGRNQVIERFVSPSRSVFSDPEGHVTSSPDGITHVVQTTQSNKNNEYLLRCWRFNHTDPLGRYSLEVQVNDIRFPTQTFELVR